MTISSKKRKYIKRNYRQLSPREIANELKIKEKEVKKVIQEIEAGDIETYRTNKLITILDKVIEYGVYVLVIFLPLFFIRPIYQLFTISKTTFAEILILSLFILWLFKINLEKRWVIRKTPIIFPLLFYFLLITISLLWAVNPFQSLDYILYLFICILLFLTVKENLTSMETIKRIISFSLIGGALVAFIGICQYFTEFNWIPQVAPPSSTFGNRNMAAQYLIMVIPLSFAAWGVSQNSFKKALYILCLFMMIFYLTLTTTRGAWLGLVGGFFFGVATFFFARRRNFYKRPLMERKNIILPLSIIITTVILILCFSFSRIMTTEKMKIDQNLLNKIKSIAQMRRDTVKARIVNWENTWEMAKDHFFFGVGIENYKIHYPRYSHKIERSLHMSLEGGEKRTHNDYLQILSELGIFGLSIYLWMVATFFYMIWHTLKKSDNNDINFLALGISIGLFAFLIHSFFSFPNRKPVPMLFSFLFFGINAILYSEVKKVKPFIIDLKDKRSQYLIKPILVGSFILLLFVIIWNVRFITADYHYKRFLAYSELQKNAFAYQEAEKMINLYPYFYKYWIAWGAINSKLGKYDEAIAINNRALKYDPYRFQLLINQGGNYLYKGQYEKAVAQLHKILEFNPSIAEAHKNLGMIYYNNLNDIEKAIFHCKEAIRLRPSFKKDKIIKMILTKTKY